MFLTNEKNEQEHKHRCGVRFLLHLRHKKGLSWFRNYIADKNFSKVVWDDFYSQWKLGNRGIWGEWKCQDGLLF